MMGSPILTTASTILCPHGGRVVPTSPDGRALAMGQPTLAATGSFVVTGCPHAAPDGRPDPCATVHWVSSGSRVRAGGLPILTQISQGVATSARGTAAGTVMIAETQSRIAAE
ncbi:hypothetical protein [Mesorhizobium sp. GR13]|uniref:hypothetical protein n=1 Tax=Mesorhizobium sp. GR13 TaxID=2562308 RepID=UPI0010BFD33F|nr:hypothetical protein [Mesorhizobium sp. GR13]